MTFFIRSPKLNEDTTYKELFHPDAHVTDSECPFLTSYITCVFGTHAHSGDVEAIEGHVIAVRMAPISAKPHQIFEQPEDKGDIANVALGCFDRIQRKEFGVSF